MTCATWAAFKKTMSDKLLSYQFSDEGNYYQIYGQDGLFVWSYSLVKGSADAVDFDDNFKATANGPNDLRTNDRRQIVAINRIPGGNTVYPTGKSDALQASGFRAGVDLIFDPSHKTRRFQMIGPWYGIGGRVVWENADLDDYMDAYLKAPATSHGVNETGNFNKYALGGGLNMFTPAAPGAGAWNLSLTAKHSGTNVLKCVPVPVAGNTGFFDYDPDSNVVTVNADQKGGYNLYDFEATLFCFASRCWGRKQDGAESSLEIPDVVGKLLFPQWVVDFTLTTSKLTLIKVGIVMITAVKGNV